MTLLNLFLKLFIFAVFFYSIFKLNMLELTSVSFSKSIVLYQNMFQSTIVGVVLYNQLVNIHAMHDMVIEYRNALGSIKIRSLLQPLLTVSKRALPISSLRGIDASIAYHSLSALLLSLLSPLVLILVVTMVHELTQIHYNLFHIKISIDYSKPAFEIYLNNMILTKSVNLD